MSIKEQFKKEKLFKFSPYLVRIRSWWVLLIRPAVTGVYESRRVCGAEYVITQGREGSETD